MAKDAGKSLVFARRNAFNHHPLPLRGWRISVGSDAFKIIESSPCRLFAGTHNASQRYFSEEELERLAWKFVRCRPGPERIRWWYRVFLIGAGVGGTAWGSAAYLLFPEASLANQVFVAFVPGGMAAGGISVLAPRMEACLVFLLPELLPLAVRYLSYSTLVLGAIATGLRWWSDLRRGGKCRR